MKHFNRKRLIISGVLVVSVIVLILLIGSDVFTYSRYETHVTSQNSITTAMYLLSDEYQTISVKLPDVIPSNNQYTYSFSVSNYKNDLHSDTNLKYRIHIRTTTNLPIEYDLFDTLNIENATSVVSSRSTDPDRDGTYFNHIFTDYKTMLYSENKTDNYTILFTFPEESNDTPPVNYKDAKYSGMAELIEINLESKQILASDT